MDPSNLENGLSSKIATCLNVEVGFKTRLTLRDCLETGEKGQ
jgi:hypothetical protein